MPFFTRLRRASHFSLRGQREGNQEKGHPDAAVSGHPALRLRDAAPEVHRQHIRVLAANWPRSYGPSFGLFLRHAAATKGPHYCASCAAKQKQRQISAKCVGLSFSRLREKVPGRADEGGLLILLFASARTTRAIWVPSLATGLRRECPKDGPHDVGQLAASPWMDCQQTP